MATAGKSRVHLCIRLGTEAGVRNFDLTYHISKVNIELWSLL